VLHYFKEQAADHTRRAAEAREFLLPIIKRRPGMYWLWDLLGQIWAIDDRPQAIVCYYRGRSVGGTRKGAENSGASGRMPGLRWIANQRPPGKSHTASKIASATDWRTPPDLAQLARAEFGINGWPEEGNLPTEPDVAQEAETILFGQETAVKVGGHRRSNTEKARSARGVSAVVDDGRSSCPYRKFRNIAQIPGRRAPGRGPLRAWRTANPYSVTTPAIKPYRRFLPIVCWRTEASSRPGLWFHRGGERRADICATIAPGRCPVGAE